MGDGEALANPPPAQRPGQGWAQWVVPKVLGLGVACWAESGFLRFPTVWTQRLRLRDKDLLATEDQRVSWASVNPQTCHTGQNMGA